MNFHEFTLKIRGKTERSGTEHADAIYVAGCDDATVFTTEDQVLVKFTRDAASLDGAIVSAVEQLTGAGYVIVRVEKALASGVA